MLFYYEQPLLFCEEELPEKEMKWMATCGLNWARRTPEDGEMTLSSRHRIRNSSPGGLRPSTILLGHGSSPHNWIIASENFVSLKLAGQIRVRSPTSQTCSFIHCSVATVGQRRVALLFFYCASLPSEHRTLNWNTLNRVGRTPTCTKSTSLVCSVLWCTLRVTFYIYGLYNELLYYANILC